jgi:hypothetical protein
VGVRLEFDELTTLIRSISRDEFISRRPIMFLLVTSRLEEEEDAGFNTLISKPTFKGRRQSSPARVMDVLEVDKAEGNPYPDRISIGRARNCDVAIRDPSVSKLHAHFRKRDTGELDLVDLGSQNGTCVNTRPLAPNRPEPVNAGDVLLFGSVACKLLSAAQIYDLLR